MNDHDALLAAILAQPGEDTPRLMFADCLQENGQPERAEFIRFQIELANTRVMNAAQTQREQALFASLAANAPDWCPAGWALLPWTSEDAGPPVRPYNNPAALVHRGFIRHIRCTLSVLCRDAGTLFASHPVETVYPLGVMGVYPGGSRYTLSSTALPHDTSEAVRRLHTLLVDRPAPGTTHARLEGAYAEMSARCVAFGRGEASKLSRLNSQ